MKKRNRVRVIVSIVMLIIIGMGTMYAGGQADAQGKDEKVVVKMAMQWWTEPGRKELFEQFKDDFEASHPNIIIEPVGMSYTEYYDKIKILLSSKDAPALFVGTQVVTNLWHELGFLEPLDAYYDMPSLLEEVSSKAAMEQAKFDNKYYGMVVEICSYSGLVYNKKLLAEAGVAVPTTPEEFYEAAKKLTNGTQQYGFITANSADNPQHIMQEAMPIINGFGGRIINNNGEFGVADAEFIEGVKFWEKMNASGAVPNNMVYNTQRKLFFQGKAAMCMDGGYFVNWARSENPEVWKDIDVAAPPFPSQLNSTDITYFFINANVSEAQKKAAVEVLNFFMRPEFQNKWIRECGYPVTLKSAVTPEFRAEYPWFQVYEDLAEFVEPMSVTGYESQSDEIRRTIADYLLKVIFTDEPVESIMSDCKAELESIVR
jgi:multiple sugar transport system substrate-binding protein